MLRKLTLPLPFLVIAAAFGETPAVSPSVERAVETVSVVAPAAEKTRVVVVPVRDQIAEPILFIIRRVLKESEGSADLVVLDMDTPGGALGQTLEIMEALDKFPGRTATYVNSKALSAGAFISSVTDDIYFAPGSTIGAAAPVSGDGKEIDESMRQKVVSFLRARVRAASEGRGTFRGEVISAMIDANFELKIGDRVLKPKGELLTLTSSEAMATYGEPAQTLLGAGVAKTLEELLDQKLGAGRYTLTRVEITWSEELAQFLTNISPILMGLGMLLLFIEFKTPGFGLPGIAGGALLATVFAANYVAGLSGHEPAIVFLIGVVLLVVELFFFPGILVLGLTGGVLMLGSLVWSLSDLWPGQPVEFSGEVFLAPIYNVALAAAIAAVGALIALRFLPKTMLWSRLVLSDAITGTAQTGAHVDTRTSEETDTLIGRTGRALTALFPNGEVEVDGVRYQARLDVGSAQPGAEIIVRARGSFGLIVEVKTS